MISIIQKMKMSLIAALILCLSGCVTSRPVDFEFRGERCIVSERFDKCRCYDYLITPTFSGNISSARDENLSYCDNFVGFNATTWVDFLAQLRGVLQKTGQKTSRHESGADIIYQIMELENGL
jgi:hypothetical protein